MDPVLEPRLTKKALAVKLGQAMGLKKVKSSTVANLLREGMPHVLSLSGKRQEFLWSQVLAWLNDRDNRRPAPKMKRFA